MKKCMKQLLCMALALCIIACLAPQRADAYTKRYTSNITTLRQNTYVTGKGYVTNYNSSTDTSTTTSYYYKITVPSGGYVTFNTNNKSKGFYLFKTLNKNKAYYDNKYVGYLYNYTSYYRVLPAGTYYMFAEKGLKVKWAFHKAATTTNYCRSRAAGLSIGKKTTAVFTRGYEFGKWYKVTLSSKKTLTVYVTDLTQKSNLSADVFNAAGVRISTSRVNDTTIRTKTLTKGTYYIRLRPSDYYSDNDYYVGRIGTIMWR